MSTPDIGEKFYVSNPEGLNAAGLESNIPQGTTLRITITTKKIIRFAIDKFFQNAAKQPVEERVEQSEQQAEISLSKLKRHCRRERRAPWNNEPLRKREAELLNKVTPHIPCEFRKTDTLETARDLLLTAFQNSLKRATKDIFSSKG